MLSKLIQWRGRYAKLGKKVKTGEMRNCQFCDEVDMLTSMQVRTEFGETGLACALCVQAIDEMGGEEAFGGNWWDDAMTGSTVNSVNASTSYVMAPLCYHNCRPLKLPEDKGFLYLSGKRGVSSPVEGTLPTVGVYLYDGWIPTNSIWTNDGTVVRQMEGADEARGLEIRKMYVEWGDMRSVPLSTLSLVLKYIHNALENGEDIEVACMGGHGRTGTLAAAMCMMYNMGVKEAINHVREEYCKEAIESCEQVDMLFDLYEAMYPDREVEEGRDTVIPKKILKVETKVVSTPMVSSSSPYQLQFMDVKTNGYGGYGHVS
jgi:hypothetical protein